MLDESEQDRADLNRDASVDIAEALRIYLHYAMGMDTFVF